MAEKIEIEFELKYKDALKNVDKLEKELKDVQETIKKSNEETVKGIEDVEKSAEGGAKGTKKVGLSIKNIASAVGIVALLQKAFEFVSNAIQENQQVMDGLNIVFETAQIVFNQVLNAFIDIYKSVTQTSENFDALGKVISGLMTLVFTPFKLLFFEIKAALQVANLAYQSLFGDSESVEAAKQALIETGESIKKVGTDAVEAGKSIVENFSEAVTEVGDIAGKVVEGFGKVSIKVATETAKSNIQLKKSAAIAAAESRMALERYATESEQLRQIRDDDRNSIEDRIKANNDLKTVLQNQQKEMLANVAMVEKAAQATFDLTGKDEDYIALLDAKAEKLGVISAIEGFNSEQKSNDTALTKEQIDLTKSQLESESLLSIERQRFNADQITDEVARLTRMQEIDAIEKEQETARLQGIVDTANAGTQAKIDAQTALNEFMETSRQTDVTRKKEIATAELERDKENTEKKIALDKELSDSKKQAFDDLIALGGAETKFGKAMLIAKQLLLAKELIMEIKSTIMKAKNSATATVIKASEAGVDVASGAAKAASALPPPLNIPLIIGYAVQAVGIISSIKSAMSASKQATSKVGASGSTPQIEAPSASAGSIPSAPPEFNSVGASDTNQLADAIGGQSQQPIQTFVVSQDITSAQSLERNIVTGATID